MLTEQLPAGAIAAAILMAPGFHGSGRFEVTEANHPPVAAPFAQAPTFRVFEGDVQVFALRQKYLEFSTALSAPLHFSVVPAEQELSQTPAGQISELRRISGLTWAQLADVFGVSARAPFHWASGKAVSAENHRRLGQALAAVKYVDRGSAEANRNLLLGSVPSGQTFLELLRNEEFDLVRQLAGPGQGRAASPSPLSIDAERFNARKHWGKALVEGAEIDGAEIKPVTEPKLRRAKARRVVA